MREAKRPPTLNHTKSSPPDVQPESRAQTDKQRSYSVQLDERDEPPIPKMKRAETMPHQKHRDSAPEKGSRLRNSAYPTPDTSPERQPRKYNYGPSQAYADDAEYASPDGYEVPSSSRYETDERKPERGSSNKRGRYAEEPTVAKESRDRQRSSSNKHAAAQPPPLPRTQSTSYVYRNGQVAEEYRPTLPRENSGRLYGEIPTTSRSPGTTRARYSPPAAEPYTRDFSADRLNMQTGYKVKERPGNSRRETRTSQPVR